MPERPAPTRKPTRKAQERQQEALDNSEIWFRVGETTYSVSFADITGMEERIIRRVVGAPVSVIMDHMESAPGLDDLAAMMWISAIQDGGPATEAAFEECLGAISYGTEVEMFDGKPEGAEPRPEA